MPTALTSEKTIQTLILNAKQAGFGTYAATSSGTTLLLDDDCSKRALKFTGTGGGTHTVIFPQLAAKDAGLGWIIDNVSTSTLSVKSYNSASDDTSFCTALSITAQKATQIYWNGTVFRETATEITTS